MRHRSSTLIQNQGLLAIGADRGFTLFELIIGIGLFSLLGLISASMITYLNRSTVEKAISVTRANVSMDLSRNTGSLNVIKASLHQAENAAFLHCVCGSATNPCTGGQLTALSLYLPTDTPPKANTVYYDSSGALCQGANNPRCVLQVQTSFMAQCLPPLPSSRPCPSTC